ncbi:MAG: ABC transporter permease [Armatimonadetes bacterium]|nr:ABC transporter permease [Armatimonadota bacterium]MDW8120971.1 permease-like cell division protein FtsX [Armatimonadota bacterium]
MGWISLFAFFLEEAWVNLRRHLVASLATVSTVALTVGLWTSFTSASKGLETLLAWEGKKLTELRVGLKLWVKEEQAKQVVEKVQKLPFVEQVRFVHKNEALKQMERAYGNAVPFQELIGHNPLPHSLEVVCRSPEWVTQCQKVLKTFPEVDWIGHHPEAVERFLAIVNGVKVTGAALSLVLALVAFALIHNDIQITVYGRRNEIRIMQLVGATAWTVRGPLIMEGVLYGIFGSLLAVAILGSLMRILSERVPTGFAQGLLHACQLDSMTVMTVLGLGLLLAGTSALIASIRLVRVV